MKIIKLYANWCGPCKVVEQTLLDLGIEHESINIESDEGDELASKYSIRSIPALFISKLNLSPFWQRFLDLVPYTALTALVFPGVFYCIDNNQYAAYIGTAVAILSAICKISLSVTVLLAVVGAFIGIVAF